MPNKQKEDEGQNVQAHPSKPIRRSSRKPKADKSSQASAPPIFDGVEEPRSEPIASPNSPVLPHQGLEPGRAVIHQDFYDGRSRRIAAMDAPEHGNQHSFMLEVQEVDETIGVVRKPYCSEISFQKGPLAEVGPNGWSESDLVVILIDRFTNFEAGASQPENKEILQGLLRVHDSMEQRRKRKIAEREEEMASKKRKKAKVKPIIF